MMQQWIATGQMNSEAFRENAWLYADAHIRGGGVFIEQLSR